MQKTKLCENPDHRFSIQQIDYTSWLEGTKVNLAEDYLAGYTSPVDDFLRRIKEPELKEFQKMLEAISPKELNDYVEEHKNKSVLLLVLMLTGKCNANCNICFTNGKQKKDELSVNERNDVLRQVKELGARFVYIPGEGEPTLDPGFWDLLETCKSLNMPAIIFTNGIILSHSATCRKYWGLCPDEAVRKLAEYPVYLYYKFWTTSEILASELLNVSPYLLPYTTYDGLPVPEGLVRLLHFFPRERIGIEAVVMEQNADELAKIIIPFAEGHNIARIIEMIQHNGKIFANGFYDPTEKQMERIYHLLSPTSCTMAPVMAVVTSRGFLSPRIGVLEHQIPGTPVSVRSNEDLAYLLHNVDYIVNLRYHIHYCVCEKLPLQLGLDREETGLRPIKNVIPPSLFNITEE